MLVIMIVIGLCSIALFAWYKLCCGYRMNIWGGRYTAMELAGMILTCGRWRPVAYPASTSTSAGYPASPAAAYPASFASPVGSPASGQFVEMSQVSASNNNNKPPGYFNGYAQSPTAVNAADNGLTGGRQMGIVNGVVVMMPCNNSNNSVEGTTSVPATLPASASYHSRPARPTRETALGDSDSGSAQSSSFASSITSKLQRLWPFGRAPRPLDAEEEDLHSLPTLPTAVPAPSPTLSQRSSGEQRSEGVSSTAPASVVQREAVSKSSAVAAAAAVDSEDEVDPYTDTEDVKRDRDPFTDHHDPFAEEAVVAAADPFAENGGAAVAPVIASAAAAAVVASAAVVNEVAVGEEPLHDEEEQL